MVQANSQVVFSAYTNPAQMEGHGINLQQSHRAVSLRHMHLLTDQY